MKTKYTLTIAGSEINVVTDMEESEVESVVGMIERKMRVFISSSKFCSKYEAALLCSLDLGADKLKSKNELDAIKDELEAAEKENKKLDLENQELRQTIAQLKAGTYESRPEADEDSTKKKGNNRVGSMFDLLTFSDDI